MQRTELAELGEFGLIRHLTQGLPKHNDTTVLGVGDDAAIVAYPEGTETLVTTDLLLEGIHYDLTYTPLKHLGYKAAVSSFSDIYAMYGHPQQLTVSLGVSARFALDAITDPAGREALQAGGRARLDAENIRHLLARCQDVSAPVRAYFYSVVVWVASADDPRPLIAEGLWWGTLLAQPRGEGGFGYDPIFQPDGHACSAAELSADEKNAISHRHRALVRLNTLLDEAGI